MARPLKPRTPLGERLIAVREHLGFIKRDGFAERLSVPANTLGTYERGIAAPSPDLLATYHREFGVNVNWLVTGEGDMLDDSSKTPAKPITVEETDFRQFANTMVQKIGSLEQRLEPPPPPPVTIKYYSVQASAGGGADVLYESQGVDMDMQALASELLHIKPKHAGLLRIKGDSMLNTLAEGDVAVMDRSDRDPEDGGLYVVSIEGQVFVKRAKWVGLAHLQWCSDNPAHDPFDVRNGDLNHMNVIGRVVWVWRNVR